MFSSFNDSKNTYTKHTFAINKIISTSYIWMSVALIITSVIAFIVSHNTMLLKLIFSNPMITIAIFIAQIGLILGINFGINKFSASTATAMLFLYAMTVGLTLSIIFLRYTDFQIFSTLFSTSVLFAFMSVIGFVTKKDLTNFGNIMFSLLFGIIIASFINYFLHSSFMEYIISLIGVVVFLGLTIYDTQKLKRIALENIQENPETQTKIIVICALNLYLDFINLFLYLLRLNNRD